MTKWQPIATAPRDGTPILAAWKTGAGSLGYVEAPRIVFLTWFDGKHSYTEPTHWMAIPAPPKEAA